MRLTFNEHYTNLKVKITQSCPTLCNSTDCSPPRSSILLIFQARILEWVAMSSSRGSSQPRMEPISPVLPALLEDSLPSEPPGEVFPQWVSRKRINLQCPRHKRHGFHSWLERSPRGGNGNPLQYSCLKISHEQRSLVGYSPVDCKESNMTEQLSTAGTKVSSYIMSKENSADLGFSLKHRQIDRQIDTDIRKGTSIGILSCKDEPSFLTAMSIMSILGH